MRNSIFVCTPMQHESIRMNMFRFNQFNHIDALQSSFENKRCKKISNHLQMYLKSKVIAQQSVRYK